MSTISAFSQTSETKKTASDVAEESRKMAQEVYQAHGGVKFKQAKTIAISGTADITSSDMPIPMSGSFAIIIAGEKGRFQLNTAFFSFSQVFADGNLLSSMDGISLPPVSQTGFAVIPHFENKDLIINKDENSKPNTFYATMPSGYRTLFEIDSKTKLIKGYKSIFEFNGAQKTTVCEIDSYTTINQIVFPEKFSQSFDFGQMTFYVKFKTKTIQTNIEVADDVFTIKDSKINGLD